MKYLWRIYYFFKKPPGVGKSGHVKAFARKDGIKIIEMKISK